MDWIIFWTLLAQVSIGVIIFAILSIPVGFAVSCLVRGVVRALPAKRTGYEIFLGDGND